MKRIHFFFLTTIFLLAACKEETPLSFSSEIITEGDLDLCSDAPCPAVTANFVRAQGDSDMAELINEKITSFICASLYMGEGEPPKGQAVPEAMTQFIERYWEDKAQFPDLASPYEARVGVSESFSSENLISFTMRQYSYTGGAHGYESTQFLNVDRKTGAVLSNEELFKDISAFAEFAETKVRQQYKIPPEESINSTGFAFENEKFVLPQAIGFNRNYIILWYNPYDIASYAQGNIEILIPKKEAGRFLAIQ